MECSIRRSSTIRQTDRIYQEPPADSTYKHVSLRISTHDEERKDASPDQLFSLFISLVAEVHRNTDEVKQGFLSGIMHKDVEAADFGSQFVGKGRSFSVRCLKFEPPDRPLALKSVLPFENFTSREEKERLGDVILVLRALSHPWLRGHPNIIQLLGLGWETDSANISRKWPVLILEYADGGTLEDFLQRHPDMTFQERLKLCLDVLNGLDALHRCAIVHGDLKPLNVLVCLEQNDGNDKTWTATLADFGGSILDVGENERGCLTMGSFPWQAPEWMDWLSREELLATDLYSLGLLVWSVMANGLDPVKNDLAIFGLEQYSTNSNALQEQVLKFKSSRPSQFLECLMQAAAGKFAPDVDRELIFKALAVTAVKESKSRSIKVLRSLLEHEISKNRGPMTTNHDPKLEQEEKADLSFAPITKISNIENILVWYF
jgi:serine/threonine protein kinase